MLDSEVEVDQNDSTRGSKFKLSLEKVDDLLNVIYETLDIQEEKFQLSRHDEMYYGLERKERVFPWFCVI